MPIAELPENTELIYANWVRLNGTLLDLSFDFGYAEEAFSGPPENFPARVVMSWESAKVLAELLNEHLRVYEESVGEVRDFGDGGKEEDDAADTSAN